MSLALLTIGTGVLIFLAAWLAGKIVPEFDLPISTSVRHPHILVADIAGDRDGDYTARLISAFREKLRLGGRYTLPVRLELTGVPLVLDEKGLARLRNKGRRLLCEHGADVLIWGWLPFESANIRLCVLAAEPIGRITHNEESSPPRQGEGSISGMGEPELPRLLFSPERVKVGLDEISGQEGGIQAGSAQLSLVLAMAVATAWPWKEARHGQLTRILQPLMKNIGKDRSGRILSRQVEAWLAATWGMAEAGQTVNDGRSLRDAERALELARSVYRQVLAEWPVNAVRSGRAAVQNNLAAVDLALADSETFPHRGDRRALLTEATESIRLALGYFTGTGHPRRRARLLADNISALKRLGTRNGNTDLLKQAARDLADLTEILRRQQKKHAIRDSQRGQSESSQRYN